MNQLNQKLTPIANRYVFGMLIVCLKDSQESFRTSCICDIEANQIIQLTEKLPLPLQFQENCYGYFYIAGKEKEYVSLEKLKRLFGGRELCEKPKLN